MISQTLQNLVDPNMEAGKNTCKCTENPQIPRKNQENEHGMFAEAFMNDSLLL